jgi:hypothetical protein
VRESINQTGGKAALSFHNHYLSHLFQYYTFHYQKSKRIKNAHKNKNIINKNRKVGGKGKINKIGKKKSLKHCFFFCVLFYW